MALEREDLSGLRFNSLVVLEVSHRTKGGWFWRCVCDCGKETIVRGSHLKTGNTKSCGCLSSVTSALLNTTHGLSKTELYRRWYNMMSRCYNNKDDSYKYYGGRGIAVCDDWKDVKNFCVWAGAEDSEYKKGYSLERIDNNKDYGPSNCTWIPKNSQTKNRRSNRWLTYRGETKTLAEWSRQLGIKQGTLDSRLKDWGNNIERAFTEPIYKRQQQASLARSKK